MKAEEFVEQMKFIKPQKEKIDKLNLSENFVKKFIISYDINPLVNTKKTDYNDEILNLVSKYDVSNIEIGPITFTNNLISDDSYIYIGFHEADDIVFEKSSNKIKLLDHETGEYIINCAENGSSFLECLIIAEKLFIKGFFDEKDEDIDKVAFQCASLAGGETYIEYYNYLLN